MGSSPTLKWIAGGTAAVVLLAVASNSSHQSTVPAATQPAATAAAVEPMAPVQPSPYENPYDTPHPSTPPPGSVFTQTLSLGSSGTAVANLQQFLADDGDYFGTDTGIFDGQTLAAVNAFQHKYEITTETGIFGSKSIALANVMLDNRPEWVTTVYCHGKSYTNVNGATVSPPCYADSQPAGASAICGDGTYSFSMHHSGTCSHHGGVAQWLQ
jgi:peptidoglycan hydrolase-like protein with peptidoglycan-binding domain